MTALGTGETYSYDANGNMTQRIEGGLTYTQTFNAENLLVSVTVNSQTTQFVYDGDGNLVKKIKPDGSKTIYVGGVYEVDKTSGGSTIRTVTYYPVAGAMRIDSTLYYILKDHLGSASVVTDASGNIVGEDRFYPFGETRLTTGTIYTDRLFTGQREMAVLGIYHFNARFYSPRLGRFLSADTIVPGYWNPQNLNRFSYVRNNPLRYTDPTGHVECRTQEECQDMGTTPGGGFTTPKPKSGGDGGGGNSCSTHPEVCGDLPYTLPDIITVPTITTTETQTNGEGNQDSGIIRWPDYVSINIATGWPWALVGFDIQVTRDYYNNWYVSPGVYGGTPGITVFGGWILQKEQPLEVDIEDFVTSHSVFAGGGYWGGGGGTWGHPFDGELNWNDFAGEVGFSTPGGAGGWTYGFLVYDNGDASPWITWHDIVDQVKGSK